MTAVRMVYLLCEGTDDRGRCLFSTGEWDANTAHQARRIAKRLGWGRTKDGRDLCPTHLAAE